MNEEINYCDYQEKVDANLLYEFNEQVKWFSSLTANERFDEIDFIGGDTKGRKTHVELKQRKGTIKQFIKWGDVLIEPSKVSRTSKIMESGYSLNEQRLYYNFVDDGVIIFNLNRVMTIKYYPSHHHFNNRDNRWENEDRFGLPMEQAIVYKKDSDGVYHRVYIEKIK